MKTMPDEKVVELVVSGKKDYFCYIVDNYKNQVFSLIIKFIGRIPETEDLAQEIFIKIYQKLAHYDSRASKFSTWFYAIAQNHCIDYLRKKKIDYHSQDISEMNNISTQKSAELPEDAYLAKERRLALGEAIGKLETKYRLPLIYKYVQNISYEEIAEIMNLPLGTIKTYIYRGKEKLLGYINLN